MGRPKGGSVPPRQRSPEAHAALNAEAHQLDQLARARQQAGATYVLRQDRLAREARAELDREAGNDDGGAEHARTPPQPATGPGPTGGAEEAPSI